MPSIRETAHALISHPEWPDFERAFFEEHGRGALHGVIRVIEELKDMPEDTVGELRKNLDTLRARLKEARRAVLACSPWLQGVDGFPLEAHLQSAIQRLATPVDEEAELYFGWRLRRKSPHAKARRLILRFDTCFCGLGYETLARLARIVFDDPTYDKSFAQRVLAERRRMERNNPLIQDALRRRREARKV